MHTSHGSSFQDKGRSYYHLFLQYTSQGHCAHSLSWKEVTVKGGKLAKPGAVSRKTDTECFKWCILRKAFWILSYKAATMREKFLNGKRVKLGKNQIGLLILGYHQRNFHAIHVSKSNWYILLSEYCLYLKVWTRKVGKVPKRLSDLIAHMYVLMSTCGWSALHILWVYDQGMIYVLVRENGRMEQEHKFKWKRPGKLWCSFNWLRIHVEWAAHSLYI